MTVYINRSTSVGELVFHFGLNNSKKLILAFSGKRMLLQHLVDFLKLDKLENPYFDETLKITIPRIGEYNSMLRFSVAKELYLKGYDLQYIVNQTGLDFQVIVTKLPSLTEFKGKL